MDRNGPWPRFPHQQGREPMNQQPLPPGTEQTLLPPTIPLGMRPIRPNIDVGQHNAYDNVPQSRTRVMAVDDYRSNHGHGGPSTQAPMSQPRLASPEGFRPSSGPASTYASAQVPQRPERPRPNSGHGSYPDAQASQTGRSNWEVSSFTGTPASQRELHNVEDNRFNSRQPDPYAQNVRCENVTDLRAQANNFRPISEKISPFAHTSPDKPRGYRADAPEDKYDTVTGSGQYRPHNISRPNEVQPEYSDVYRRNLDDSRNLQTQYDPSMSRNNAKYSDVPLQQTSGNFGGTRNVGSGQYGRYSDDMIPSQSYERPANVAAVDNMNTFREPEDDFGMNVDPDGDNMSICSDKSDPDEFRGQPVMMFDYDHGGKKMREQQKSSQMNKRADEMARGRGGGGRMNSGIKERASEVGRSAPRGRMHSGMQANKRAGEMVKTGASGRMYSGTPATRNEGRRGLAPADRDDRNTAGRMEGRIHPARGSAQADRGIDRNTAGRMEGRIHPARGSAQADRGIDRNTAGRLEGRIPPARGSAQADRGIDRNTAGRMEGRIPPARGSAQADRGIDRNTAERLEGRIPPARGSAQADRGIDRSTAGRMEGRMPSARYEGRRGSAPADRDVDCNTAGRMDGGMPSARYEDRRGPAPAGRMEKNVNRDSTEHNHGNRPRHTAGDSALSRAKELTRDAEQLAVSRGRGLTRGAERVAESRAKEFGHAKQFAMYRAKELNRDQILPSLMSGPMKTPSSELIRLTQEQNKAKKAKEPSLVHWPSKQKQQQQQSHQQQSTNDDDEDPDFVGAQLYMGNLPTDVTQKQIKDLLITHEVQVWIAARKKDRSDVCAFLKFGSLKEAKAVRLTMKGFVYRNKVMLVRLAAALDFEEYVVREGQSSSRSRSVAETAQQMRQTLQESTFGASAGTRGKARGKGDNYEVQGDNSQSSDVSGVQGVKTLIVTDRTKDVLGNPILKLKSIVNSPRTKAKFIRAMKDQEAAVEGNQSGEMGAPASSRPTAIAEKFTCETCNITLNGEMQFAQHMHGSKHELTVLRMKKAAATQALMAARAEVIAQATGRAVEPPSATTSSADFTMSSTVSSRPLKKLMKMKKAAEREELMAARAEVIAQATGGNVSSSALYTSSSAAYTLPSASYTSSSTQEQYHSRDDMGMPNKSPATRTSTGHNSGSDGYSRAHERRDTVPDSQTYDGERHDTVPDSQTHGGQTTSAGRNVTSRSDVTPHVEVTPATVATSKMAGGRSSADVNMRNQQDVSGTVSDGSTGSSPRYDSVHQFPAEVCDPSTSGNQSGSQVQTSVGERARGYNDISTFPNSTVSQLAATEMNVADIKEERGQFIVRPTPLEMVEEERGKYFVPVLERFDPDIEERFRYVKHTVERLGPEVEKERQECVVPTEDAFDPEIEEEMQKYVWAAIDGLDTEIEEKRPKYIRPVERSDPEVEERSRYVETAVETFDSNIDEKKPKYVGLTLERIDHEIEKQKGKYIVPLAERVDSDIEESEKYIMPTVERFDPEIEESSENIVVPCALFEAVDPEIEEERQNYAMPALERINFEIEESRENCFVPCAPFETVDYEIEEERQNYAMPAIERVNPEIEESRENCFVPFAPFEAVDHENEEERQNYAMPAIERVDPEIVEMREELSADSSLSLSGPVECENEMENYCEYPCASSLRSDVEHKEEGETFLDCSYPSPEPIDFKCEEDRENYYTYLCAYLEAFYLDYEQRIKLLESSMPSDPVENQHEEEVENNCKHSFASTVQVVELKHEERKPLCERPYSPSLTIETPSAEGRGKLFVQSSPLKGGKPIFEKERVNIVASPTVLKEREVFLEPPFSTSQHSEPGFEDSKHIPSPIDTALPAKFEKETEICYVLPKLLGTSRSGVESEKYFVRPTVIKTVEHKFYEEKENFFMPSNMHPENFEEVRDQDSECLFPSRTLEQNVVEEKEDALASHLPLRPLKQSLKKRLKNIWYYTLPRRELNLGLKSRGTMAVCHPIHPLNIFS